MDFRVQGLFLWGRQAEAVQGAQRSARAGCSQRAGCVWMHPWADSGEGTECQREWQSWAEMCEGCTGKLCMHLLGRNSPRRWSTIHSALQTSHRQSLLPSHHIPLSSAVGRVWMAMPEPWEFLMVPKAPEIEQVPFTLLTARNETNTHSLEGELWAALNPQRTVALVWTTVQSLNADAFDPITWGLTKKLQRMFPTHCAQIYSLSFANNFIIKTEIRKIINKTQPVCPLHSQEQRGNLFPKYVCKLLFAQSDHRGEWQTLRPVSVFQHATQPTVPLRCTVCAEDALPGCRENSAKQLQRQINY